MLCRCVTGLINGNSGVSKAYAGEITDDSNGARMFSYFGLSWGLGMMLGPVLGGLLSHPYRHFSFFFSEDGVFGTYPYLLPMLIVSVLALLSFIYVAVFLEESMRIQTGNSKSGARHITSLFRTPDYLTTTAIFCFSTLAAIGFQEMFPVFCKS
jgi:MFS family permease